MSHSPLTFYGTSIGKKVVMAASGLLLFGFVVVHMIGNLQLYLGPAQLDAYAAFLHSKPAMVWAMRLLLLAAVAVHITAATQLTLQSWAARPNKYARQRRRRSDYAARTMRYSGPLLALFIGYHLVHLTVGAGGTSFQPGHVYNNVVAGFSMPCVAGFYVVAMLALGLHMYHGLWSLSQTLGADHPRLNRWRRIIAAGITFVVVAANISMPVAVLTGVVS